MVIHQFNRIIRNKWIWGVFAIAISAFFAFDFLLTGGDSGERRSSAGELNGKEVSESRFRPFAEDARGFGRNRNTTLSNAEVNRIAWENLAASQVAQALGADTLIYLTDVDGFYRNVDDPDSLIAGMTKEEAHELLFSGTLSSGMIPKIRSIVEALDAGVQDVRILNGTFPHSLLLEIFTDAGIGTMFTQGEESLP